MHAQEITIRIPAGATAEDAEMLFAKICELVTDYQPSPDWPRVTVGMMRYASDPTGPEMFLTPKRD